MTETANFPLDQPAVAGSFTMNAEDFDNLQGPDGRAARLVRVLGVSKFCKETLLSRQTGQRILRDGLKPTSRCCVAVIACLKKYQH